MDNYQLGHDILPFLEALESYDKTDLSYNSMLKGLRTYEVREKHKAEYLSNQPRRRETADRSLNQFGTFLMIAGWLAFVAGIIFMFVLPVYNTYKKVSGPDFNRLLSSLNINGALLAVSATTLFLCFSSRIKNPRESVGSNMVCGIWSAIASVLLTMAYSLKLKSGYIVASTLNLDPELADFYNCSKFFILTSMTFVLCNVYGAKFGVFLHGLIREGILYRGEDIKKMTKGQKTFVIFLIIGILFSLTIQAKYFFRATWIFSNPDSSSIAMYLLYIQIIVLAIVFRVNTRRFGIIEENLYCAFAVINFTSICIHYITCPMSESYLLASFIAGLVVALLVLVDLQERETHIAGFSNWMIVFLAFSAYAAHYILYVNPSASYYDMMDQTLLFPSILVSVIAIKNVLLRLAKLR